MQCFFSFKKLCKLFHCDLKFEVGNFKNMKLKNGKCERLGLFFDLMDSLGWMNGARALSESWTIGRRHQQSLLMKKHTQAKASKNNNR